MRVANINNIKIFALSSLLSLGASSCIKKPYVEMPQEKIPSEIQNSLTTMIDETSKIKNDTNYILYGRDTLLLWEDVASKQKKYLQNINNEAKYNVPQTVVDRKTVLIPTRVGNTTIMRQHVRVVKEPNFIETKAVIPSNKILTRDSVAMYVPVEYYGKHNSKVDEANDKKIEKE